MMFDFSICTPVFNRAILLPRLYLSLLENCEENTTFEWLLIDDGSTDDIASFVEQVEQDNKLIFRYIKKTNEGKHSCLNIAFAEAQGELLLILDSDDLLKPDALLLAKKRWTENRLDHNIAGLIGHCVTLDSNKMLGDSFPQDRMLSTLLANSYRLNLAGDRCDFVRVDLLRNKRFPVIEGENFMPEAVIMLDFDLHYQYLCVDEVFKIVEYQTGGLSDSFSRLAMRNPRGMVLRFEKILNEKGLLTQVDFKAKVKMAANYTRYLLHSKHGFISHMLTIRKFFAVTFIIGVAAGIVLYFKDIATIKG
jgi:glycosyltransferase involved in cell wall biosynthesis